MFHSGSHSENTNFIPSIPYLPTFGGFPWCGVASETWPDLVWSSAATWSPFWVTLSTHALAFGQSLHATTPHPPGPLHILLAWPETLPPLCTWLTPAGDGTSSLWAFPGCHIKTPFFPSLPTPISTSSAHNSIIHYL